MTFVTLNSHEGQARLQICSATSNEEARHIVMARALAELGTPFLALARDGRMYSKEEFLAHYGAQANEMWSEAVLRMREREEREARRIYGERSTPGLRNEPGTTLRTPMGHPARDEPKLRDIEAHRGGLPCGLGTGKPGRHKPMNHTSTLAALNLEATKNVTKICNKKLRAPFSLDQLD